MQRYKITEYTICIKKRKKLSNSRRKVQTHESPLVDENQEKKWFSLLDCNLSNCNFSGFFAAISLDDHFFKPHFLNLLANYVECVDDATVAVQLEPTLIKAIKKGGFFRHKPSTFCSLILPKKYCVVCGRWLHPKCQLYLVCQCLLCG